MDKHFTFDDMINTMMPLTSRKKRPIRKKKTADSTSVASSASIASINKKLVASG